MSFRIIFIAILLSFTLSLFDCSSKAVRSEAESPVSSGMPLTSGSSQASAQRMLIKQAQMTVEVEDVASSSKSAVDTTTRLGGFVEKATADGDAHSVLKLRVPAAELDNAMNAFAKMGKERERKVSVVDVTDSVIDLEAKLKNDLALRDRLRDLIRQAKQMKDILDLETQLTRVQTEVDSLEGRLKEIRGEVAMSALELTIDRRQILGPLGWIGYGIGWVIEKLVFIQN